MKAAEGDEVTIDRWLAVHDERLRYLQSSHMQQRLAGQFAAETDLDLEEQASGTAPPPLLRPREARRRSCSRTGAPFA